MTCASRLLAPVVLGFLVLASPVTGQTAQTAQAPRPAQATPRPVVPTTATLLVTVVDSSGAVLPTAAVTVTGQEDATRVPELAPIQASMQGLATLPGLKPGRYNIQAEFSGFETNILKDVRLRVGENKHVIILQLQRFQEEVTVAQDAQRGAADPRGSSFGAALTREQVDALSDDPTELQQQLADMAGPGSVIRVDSFEGSQLPPKSQIKSIHITRDGFAAENHNPNAFFVDIITQPGVGPIRGQLNLRSRPGNFSGKSPFVETKGSEQTEDFTGNVGGSLAQQKSSFNIYAQRYHSYDTAILNAALPTGTLSQTSTIRQPQDRWFVNALVDYALNSAQTMRGGYFENHGTADNQGVGGFDLTDRAFSNEFSGRGFYLQEVGPIGRRMFLNTRFNGNWNRNASHALFEAPTIRVNDAFTSGGAQQAGARHAANVSFASDLDYIRGVHSVRMGVMLNWAYISSTSTTNYLGTYTFASLADYEAGRPTLYTQRIGNPLVEYGGPIGGAYIQDDIRVSKALTLSPGLRWEEMIRINKYFNPGPRFGVTWAPFKSGKTTLRASSGIFYDYLGADNYEQTIRVDGYHQTEINVVNPAYPNPNVQSAAGAALPSNRYQFAPVMAMPRNMRVSGGIDQTLSPRARVSVSYAYVKGDHLFRGQNLNAPANGVRSNPLFANIIQVSPDARMEQKQLTTSFNWSLSQQAPSPIPGVAAGRPFDWRRISFTGTYTLASTMNDTDGTFSVPPGSVADDWGPASYDVRNRLFVSMNNQVWKNLSAVVTLTGASGTPYSIRTGQDNNGDSIFNDRPVGVGRNTERGAAQWWLNANFTYTIPLGNRPGVGPPGGVGIVQGAPGQGPQIVQAGAPVAKYRMVIGINAQNITNHANYVGYSGIITSPFFGQPTAVVNPRKVDVTVGLNF